MTQQVPYRTLLGVAAATCGIAVITLAVLVSAAYFGYRELRAIDAKSKLTSTRVLLSEFDSRGMRSLRATVAADLMNKTKPKPDEAEGILDYFEEVGELARRHELDEEMVWNQISVSVRCYWNGGLGNYVRDRRGTMGDPTWFQDTEWLERAMALDEARRRGIPLTETLLTDERIRECLKSETNLAHVLQRARR